MHFLYHNDIDHFLDHLKLRGFHHHFSKLALSNRILFSATEFKLHSRIFTQNIITATNNWNEIGSDCSIKVFMCVFVCLCEWVSAWWRPYFCVCVYPRVRIPHFLIHLTADWWVYMIKRSIRSTCHPINIALLHLCARDGLHQRQTSSKTLKKQGENWEVWRALFYFV